MSFESDLARGVFRIPECAACRAPVWPPSPRCPRCLGPSGPGGADPVGTVLESSGAAGGFFCVVDFGGGARLVAGSQDELVPGRRVRITGCGVRDGRCYFEAGPASST